MYDLIFVTCSEETFETKLRIHSSRSHAGFSLCSFGGCPFWLAELHAQIQSGWRAMFGFIITPGHDIFYVPCVNVSSKH